MSPVADGATAHRMSDPTAPTLPRIAPDDLLRALVAEHGTPLFVYDTARIQGQIEALDRLLKRLTRRADHGAL